MNARGSQRPFQDLYMAAVIREPCAEALVPALGRAGAGATLGARESDGGAPRPPSPPKPSAQPDTRASHRFAPSGVQGMAARQTLRRLRLIPGAASWCPEVIRQSRERRARGANSLPHCHNQAVPLRCWRGQPRGSHPSGRSASVPSASAESLPGSARYDPACCWPPRSAGC